MTTQSGPEKPNLADSTTIVSPALLVELRLLLGAPTERWESLIRALLAQTAVTQIHPILAPVVLICMN